MAKILVTGAAGFIGYHTAARLLERGDSVVGLDSMSDYYDVSLKEARLARLRPNDGFRFERVDVADRDRMAALFARDLYEMYRNYCERHGWKFDVSDFSEAERGGFDAGSFWSRGGVAHMLTEPGKPPIMQRAAFGDTIGATFIAGGIRNAGIDAEVKNQAPVPSNL